MHIYSMPNFKLDNACSVYVFIFFSMGTRNRTREFRNSGESSGPPRLALVAAVQHGLAKDLAI